jgi:hypothetical protein
MNLACLVLLVAFVLFYYILVRYYRRQWRDAMREVQMTKNSLRQSIGETNLALQCSHDFKRLLDNERTLNAIVAACAMREHENRLTECARAYQYGMSKLRQEADQAAMVLLTEIGDAVLLQAHANYVAEAWKSYAIAYEVLCETAADKDKAGAKNASAAVAEARRVLEAMGQYDA